VVEMKEEEVKIKFQGNEVKPEKHQGMELPFCPFCGKELFCLFDKDRRIVSISVDLILFCKNCRIFWYNDKTYYALTRIYDLRKWELELK
jgi:hypothetical protein